MSDPNKPIALVLSGGGARGAYQVGVLSAIAEIAQQLKIKNPFCIYSGVSAGAINASFLATGADDFYNTTKRLVDLWSGLTSEQIFHSDAINLGRLGVKWIEQLSRGGLQQNLSPSRALMDTAPLRQLLEKKLNYELIEDHIRNGHMKALAITALDYQTSTAITFIQGEEGHKEWRKSRRHSEKAKIKTEHVMASAAIPILFPPVAVDTRFFGDGCIRNQSPCAASIYLGAKKLMVIGVRRQHELSYEARLQQAMQSPSLLRVLNTLLNAVMLDSIELDLERLKRVNDFIDQVPDEHQAKLTYQKVDFEWISPSVDIGEIASGKSNQIPRLIRYVLRGLGPIEEAAEIVSYVLFEPSFCTQLIEIGFEDGIKHTAVIEKLLTS
ncbi:MAG: patatin-like phospholipase family protein [Pseudobdellovibrionaceae bacterium]